MNESALARPSGAMEIKKPSVRDAFDDFYRAHAAMLYRHVFFRTGMDATAAQEIVSDIFAALWARKSAPQTTDEQYLYGIARRKLADFHRGRQRHEIRFADLSSDEKRWIEGLFETEPALPAPRLSPAVARIVGEALSAVDAETQALLLAKYVEGLSVRRLSQQSGKSEAAVMSLLARARKKLRDELESRMTTGGGV